MSPGLSSDALLITFTLSVSPAENLAYGTEQSIPMSGSLVISIFKNFWNIYCTNVEQHTWNVPCPSDPPDQYAGIHPLS